MVSICHSAVYFRIRVQQDSLSFTLSDSVMDKLTVMTEIKRHAHCKRLTDSAKYQLSIWVINTFYFQTAFPSMISLCSYISLEGEGRWSQLYFTWDIYGICDSHQFKFTWNKTWKLNFPIFCIEMHTIFFHSQQ